MMAKMFYTLEETKAALGKTEEEIKQLSREGRLREFRDGPRLMFKADQVEALKAELGGGDQVDLGPSDSGAPIGLVDSKGGSGNLSLSDSDVRAPAAPKEDTALAADLGLSGSLGGVPSPGRVGGSGTGMDVFRPDEVERVDPRAQTEISSQVADQVNLEGVGSGSGLLDLTREADDTSLGAGVLDDLSPGAAARAGAPAGDSGMTVVDTRVPAPSARAALMPPVTVVAADPMAPAFGLASLASVAMLLLASFVLIASLVGVRPAILESVQDKGIWFLALIGLAVAVVFFVIGAVVGKSGAK